jgi:hypothetical protein
MICKWRDTDAVTLLVVITSSSQPIGYSTSRSSHAGGGKSKVSHLLLLNAGLFQKGTLDGGLYF